MYAQAVRIFMLFKGIVHYVKNTCEQTVFRQQCADVIVVYRFVETVQIDQLFFYMTNLSTMIMRVMKVTKIDLNPLCLWLFNSNRLYKINVSL